MKIIKITTDNKISVHEFPKGNDSKCDKKLRALIGPKCSYIERVRPKRLYQELGVSNRVGREPGSGTSMLVDEEGDYNELDVNIVGSYLYESDKHGIFITGNILIIGEYETEDEMKYSGISEEQYQALYLQLKKLTEAAKQI